MSCLFFVFSFVDVDPDGFDSLVFQHRLGFKELLQIDHQTFCASLERLHISSLEGLRAAIPQWIKDTREQASLFRYALSFLLLSFHFSETHFMLFFKARCIVFLSYFFGKKAEGSDRKSVV